MSNAHELLDGFYWVRFVDSDWAVAERYDGGWYLNGDAMELSSSDFVEIDPRPIKRDTQ